MSRLIEVPSDVWSKLAMAGVVPSPTDPSDHEPSTEILTPLSDPWMGLSNPDVFTALDNGGRVQ